MITRAQVPGSSPTTSFLPFRSRATLATVYFNSMRLISSVACGPPQKYTHFPAATASTGSPPPMSSGVVISGARDTSSHDLISPSSTSWRVQLLVGRSNQRRVLSDAVTIVFGSLVQAMNLMAAVCVPSPISNPSEAWIVAAPVSPFCVGLGTSVRSKTRSRFSAPPVAMRSELSEG